jgi:DNA-binding NtrC family response regulator
MAEAPTALLLSSDESLRSSVLKWGDGRDEEWLFYEEAAGALAAARKRALLLFVADARTGTVPSSGFLRRLRDLPGEPELLLLLDERADPPDELRIDEIHRPTGDGEELREPLLRLLALARVRRTSGLVGRSLAMRELLSSIAQVAPLDVPVLIQGESGTGKEMVARALHLGSMRAGANFESVNVGSIAESLLESELFGHEKGAFTGAIARRAGVFERANRGTLFLDELGEMPPAMQVRLLRVLESGEYIRVGGVQTLWTDVRLIAATHRSLEDEMAEGRFRSDLYYRLKVIKIEIPPLRERPEDVPALVAHFLEDANRRHGLHRRGLTREAMERFLAYAWPGNVRELRNVVSSMAVLGVGEFLGAEDLPPEFAPGSRRAGTLPMLSFAGAQSTQQDPLLANSLLSIFAELRRVHQRLEALEARLDGKPREAAIESRGREFRPDFPRGMSDAEYIPVALETPRDLAGAEKVLVESALRQHRGNRRKTAERLGISERTLYRKLKSFGLG